MDIHLFLLNVNDEEIKKKFQYTALCAHTSDPYKYYYLFNVFAGSHFFMSRLVWSMCSFAQHFSVDRWFIWMKRHKMRFCSSFLSVSHANYVYHVYIQQQIIGHIAAQSMFGRERDRQREIEMKKALVVIQTGKKSMKVYSLVFFLRWPNSESDEWKKWCCHMYE